MAGKRDSEDKKTESEIEDDSDEYSTEGYQPSPKKTKINVERNKVYSKKAKSKPKPVKSAEFVKTDSSDSEQEEQQQQEHKKGSPGQMPPDRFPNQSSQRNRKRKINSAHEQSSSPTATSSKQITTKVIRVTPSASTEHQQVAKKYKRNATTIVQRYKDKREKKTADPVDPFQNVQRETGLKSWTKAELKGLKTVRYDPTYSKVISAKIDPSFLDVTTGVPILKDKSNEIIRAGGYRTNQLVKFGYLKFRVFDYQEFTDPQWVNKFTATQNNGLVDNKLLTIRYQEVFRISPGVYYVKHLSPVDGDEIPSAISAMTFGQVDELYRKMFGAPNTETFIVNFFTFLENLKITPKRLGKGLILPYIVKYEHVDMDKDISRTGLNLSQLDSPVIKFCIDHMDNRKIHHGVTVPLSVFGFTGGPITTSSLQEGPALGLVHIMNFGKEKTWLISPPRYKDKIQQELIAILTSLDLDDDDHLTKNQECILVHNCIMMGPQFFKATGIPYKIVNQGPGDIMMIASSAVHSGINTGVNGYEQVTACTLDFPRTFSFGTVQCECKIGLATSHGMDSDNLKKFTITSEILPQLLSLSKEWVDELTKRTEHKKDLVIPNTRRASTKRARDKLCGYCGATFADSRTRNRHEDEEKCTVYGTCMSSKCENSNKVYTKKNMKIHIAAMHPTKEEENEINLNRKKKQQKLLNIINARRDAEEREDEEGKKLKLKAKKKKPTVTSNVAEDVVEDVAEDVAEDVTEDVTEDVAEDMAEGATEDMTEGVAGYVAEDVAASSLFNVQQDNAVSTDLVLITTRATQVPPSQKVPVANNSTINFTTKALFPKDLILHVELDEANQPSLEFAYNNSDMNTTANPLQPGNARCRQVFVATQILHPDIPVIQYEDQHEDTTTTSMFQISSEKAPIMLTNQLNTERHVEEDKTLEIPFEDWRIHNEHVSSGNEIEFPPVVLKEEQITDEGQQTSNEGVDTSHYSNNNEEGVPVTSHQEESHIESNSTIFDDLIQFKAEENSNLPIPVDQALEPVTEDDVQFVFDGITFDQNLLTVKPETLTEEIMVKQSSLFQQEEPEVIAYELVIASGGNGDEANSPENDAQAVYDQEKCNLAENTDQTVSLNKENEMTENQDIEGTSKNCDSQNHSEKVPNQQSQKKVDSEIDASKENTLLQNTPEKESPQENEPVPIPEVGREKLFNQNLREQEPESNINEREAASTTQNEKESAYESDAETIPDESVESEESDDPNNKERPSEQDPGVIADVMENIVVEICNPTNHVHRALDGNLETTSNERKTASSAEQPSVSSMQQPKTIINEANGAATGNNDQDQESTLQQEPIRNVNEEEKSLEITTKSIKVPSEEDHIFCPKLYSVRNPNQLEPLENEEISIIDASIAGRTPNDDHNATKNDSKEECQNAGRSGQQSQSEKDHELFVGVEGSTFHEIPEHPSPPEHEPQKIADKVFLTSKVKLIDNSPKQQDSTTNADKEMEASGIEPGETSFTGGDLETTENVNLPASSTDQEAQNAGASKTNQDPTLKTDAVDLEKI